MMQLWSTDGLWWKGATEVLTKYLQKKISWNHLEPTNAKSCISFFFSFWNHSTLAPKKKTDRQKQVKWSNTCTQQAKQTSTSNPNSWTKKTAERRTQDPDSPPLGRPYLGWHRPFCTLSVDWTASYSSARKKGIKMSRWNCSGLGGAFIVFVGIRKKYDETHLFGHFLRCFLCVCHDSFRSFRFLQAKAPIDLQLVQKGGLSSTLQAQHQELVALGRCNRRFDMTHPGIWWS